jgi:signal transduction histidine kinase
MELTARDFGIGIPKEKILSVFKVYKQLSKDDYKVEPSVATILKQRRKHNGREDVGGGGYGFGLAISQYYARLCGGELVADSQIGGPTTFCLWLPTGKRGSVQDSVRPSRDVWWTR